MSLEEELLDVIHRHYPEARFAEAKSLGHIAFALSETMATVLNIAGSRMTNRNRSRELNKITNAVFLRSINPDPTLVAKVALFQLRIGN